VETDAELGFAGGASPGAERMRLWRLGLVALSLLAETTPPEAATLLKEGLELARQEKWREAEAVFARGQKIAPQDARFAAELAGISYRLGQISVAKSRLGDALGIEPANEYANDFLGTLYLLEGNLAAALKYWNRIGKPLIDELTLLPEIPLHPLLRDRGILISRGQVLRQDQLRWTQANLDRLNVLASYRIDLEAAANGRHRVLLRSTPKRHLTSGWLGRVLPMIRGLPYQAIHVDVNSIRQRAWNFESIWRWDPDKRRVAASLQAPFRLNPKLQLQAMLDIRDENWNLTTTYRGPQPFNSLLLRKYEVGGAFVTALTSKLEWTSGLSIAKRSFRGGLSEDLFQNSWSLQWPNRFHYALWELPERRARVDADVALTPGRVFAGSPSRFLITGGGLRASWAPGSSADSWRLAGRARAGHVFGSVPFDEYFILGMERDNDLWLRGHVGTHDGRKGSAPLGVQYGLLQMDVRRTVLRLPLLRMQAGPFYDAGIVGDPVHRFGSGGWMHDTGVQVTLKTAGGVGWTFVYGRDLREGRGVFYTALSR
jgi:tetratricopeptide (TPR) repeat protein